MLEYEPTATAPAEWLAWDEGFLDDAESGGGEALWFWESPVPFVVLGYGQQREREVRVDSCQAASIPVLRRCSGGGAVVQGPGCLNYGLVLEIREDGPCATITGTNHHVMERNRRALSALLADPVVTRGHTDLALATSQGDRKFSGNAQRRRRRFLLFHGTILLRFDLALLSTCLRFPSLVPAYRDGRAHNAFVMNTGLSANGVKAALRQQWSANPAAHPPPINAMRAAFEARYSRREWHERT